MLQNNQQLFPIYLNTLVKFDLSGTRYIPDMYPICVVLMQKIGYPICVEICLSLSVSSIISASSDRRRMQRSSLEPSHRAASNGGSFIPLRPLDAEIFNETSTIRHYIT